MRDSSANRTETVDDHDDDDDDDSREDGARPTTTTTATTTTTTTSTTTTTTTTTPTPTPTPRAQGSKTTILMDERDMRTGGIPLRQSSLPGHVKLPRRYEKAAMGSNNIPLRVRKVSIQPGHSALGDSLSGRLDDLMSAVMWVRQELIMMRQHDILLKRQFFNIQHSIQSLQKPKSATPTNTTTNTISTTATTTTTTTTTSSTPSTAANLPTSTTAEPPRSAYRASSVPLYEHHISNGDSRWEEEHPYENIGCSLVGDGGGKTNGGDTNNNTARRRNSNEKNGVNALTPTTSTQSQLTSSAKDDTATTTTIVTNNINNINNNNDDDFPMETFVVRPSSSVTLLCDDSEEEEDADTFAEEFFCRPRTSSMRTSRDMAALARRRGSKELI